MTNMTPSYSPPASPKLPRLHSLIWEDSRHHDDDDSDSTSDHDMQQDDSDVLTVFNEANAQTMNRTLKSSPQSDRPSLPSLKDVLRSLDLPDATTKALHNEKWKHNVHPAAASRSLSIFNCPNATYMWPSFQPASRRDSTPISYVDYTQRPRERPVDDRLAEASNSKLHSSDSKPRLQYARNPESGFSVRHSTTLSYSPRPRSTAANTPSPLMRASAVHTRSWSSDYNDAFLADRSPSPSDSYASSFSAENIDSGNYPQAPTSEGNQQWEEYTRTSTAADGKVEYECLWPHTDDPTKTCGFKRKKQGVKRHIEAKHLGIRRHVCSYCGQAFSTKLTVDCHTWRKHTGEKPLPCRYGCGKFFNDPARQFRHYESAHGYVSVHPRKKAKANVS